MNMYMRFMRSDIDPVCISMCRPGFYNKNAMYDTKKFTTDIYTHYNNMEDNYSE